MAFVKYWYSTMVSNILWRIWKHSQRWKFKNLKIAPWNSSASVLVESAAKTVNKNRMIKWLKTKEDQYFRLLNFRNIPNEGMITSPAQCLMLPIFFFFFFDTQSLTPATPSALKSSLILITEHFKRHLKLKSAQHLRNCKTLTPLKTKWFCQNRAYWWKERMEKSWSYQRTTIQQLRIFRWQTENHKNEEVSAVKSTNQHWWCWISVFCERSYPKFSVNIIIHPRTITQKSILHNL